MSQAYHGKEFASLGANQLLLICLQSHAHTHALAELEAALPRMEKSACCHEQHGCDRPVTCTMFNLA